jgi:hypothetical protein
MNSGVLDLKMRRKVSVATGTEADADPAGPAEGEAQAEAIAASGSIKQKSAAEVTRADFGEKYFIGSLDASHAQARFFAAPTGGRYPNRARPEQCFRIGQAESFSRVFCLEMAQRHRESVGSIGGLREFRH